MVYAYNQPQPGTPKKKLGGLRLRMGYTALWALRDKARNGLRSSVGQLQQAFKGRH